MEQWKFKERCKIHSEEKVTQKLKSQPFFTCLSCMTSGGFNLQDYCVIKEIIKGNKKILQKWPSINNEELMKKLIEIVSQQSSSNSNSDIIDKIMSYYKNLKVQILEQIDLSQKKMIQIAETLPQKNNVEQIIKKYQEISKLDPLRDQLLNNSTRIEEKERICTQLIEQSQSQNTIDQLQSLLNAQQQKLTLNLEPTQNIIESILNNINKIQLFQENNNILTQTLQVNNSNNILDLKLLPTDYYQGKDYLEISTNNNQQQQVKVKIDKGYCLQVVSNMIFQSNKKYIIRFKIDNLMKDNIVSIGLIQDENINKTHGENDVMFCLITNNGQQIVKKGYSLKAIDKQLKGEGLLLSESRELELRISISDKILHMLDYPNYQYQLGLQDQYIPNLINGKDLRLFIGLRSLNNTVVITHASTVNQFD